MGEEKRGGLAVEKARVAGACAGLVLLVPLVVGLEEDGALGPDQGDGDLEVEVGFVAGARDVVCWAVRAVDGPECGMCVLSDPAFPLSVLVSKKGSGTELTARRISSMC